MATEKTLQGLLRGVALTLVLVAGSGCTDDRRPEETFVPEVQAAPPVTDVNPAAEVQFQGQETQVLTMQLRGNSLFMTGRPFGFMRWDVGANAESPHLTFAASDQIDSFAPFGKWVVDWYASGAVGLLGQFAFLSGVVGTSIVNTGETHAPVEVRRYPRENENSLSDEVIQDEAFVYRAIATHPTLPIIWGFREQDFVYTIQVGSGPSMNLIRKDSYGASGETVCCVKSATVWRNKVFVAFTQKLVYFDIGSNGALSNPREIRTLQAQNVASTGRYLYVHHEPTFAQPDGVNYPGGIYVFDPSGQNVALLNVDSPFTFAVTSNDSHVLANEDDVQVKIYRIQWQ